MEDKQFISQAKLKAILDEYFINNDILDEIRVYQDKITELKTRGIMENPTKPEKGEMSEDEYERVLEEYKQRKKEYNEYKSPEYIEYQKQFDFYRKIKSIHSKLLSLLPSEKEYNEGDKKTISAKEKVARKKTISFVNSYKEKSMNLLKEKFGDTSISSIITDEKKLGELYEELEQDENINIFIQKHRLSQKKIKYNKDSLTLLSYILWRISNELIDLAIKNSYEQNMKLVTPSMLCVNYDYMDLVFYPIFSKTHFFILLREREERRNEWKTKREIEQLRRNIELEVEKRKENINTKIKVADMSDYPTFEEQEYKEDFCTRDDTKKISKSSYKWYHIDNFDDLEGELTFSNLIKKTASDKEYLDENNDKIDFRISTSLTNFISCVLFDVLHFISMGLLEVKKCAKYNTISKNALCAVVAILLQTEELTKERTEFLQELES